MRLIRFTAFSTFSSRRRLLPSILLNIMGGYKWTDEVQMNIASLSITRHPQQKRKN